jgi:xanthine dehydrogenase accessory factor
MNVWEFINEKLYDDIKVMLLYVLESEGSSPGRQGFKMAVAADGSTCGTIGGGVMEHKFVEKSKHLLQQKEKKVLLQKQIHSKEDGGNQSGMICSGSQLNVLIPLSSADKKTILHIYATKERTLQISPRGILVNRDTATGLQYRSDEDWLYTEALIPGPVIHVIGGGHVSLALCEIMSFLGFYIKVYDDRPGVNTLLQNEFANEKIIIPGYEHLGEYINPGPNEYIVIMTVGYRTDKIALQQILGKPFCYIGLLGSENKNKLLFKELVDEGVALSTLKNIFTPIGINILSKTTQEIAVSIAAEIIHEKNKGLPTGRQMAGLNL